MRVYLPAILGRHACQGCAGLALTLAPRLRVNVALSHHELVPTTRLAGLCNTVQELKQTIGSADPDFCCCNGAQVWYCVPPGKPRERFEALAASLFPDEARECKVSLLWGLNQHGV